MSAFDELRARYAEVARNNAMIMAYTPERVPGL
jgi:hypothetical protein